MTTCSDCILYEPILSCRIHKYAEDFCPCRECILIGICSDDCSKYNRMHDLLLPFELDSLLMNKQEMLEYLTPALQEE